MLLFKFTLLFQLFPVREFDEFFSLGVQSGLRIAVQPFPLDGGNHGIGLTGIKMIFFCEPADLLLGKYDREPFFCGISSAGSIEKAHKVFIFPEFFRRHVHMSLFKVQQYNFHLRSRREKSISPIIVAHSSHFESLCISGDCARLYISWHLCLFPNDFYLLSFWGLWNCCAKPPLRCANYHSAHRILLSFI